MSDVHEQPRDHPQPLGSGWRRLEPAVPVRAYFANGWHDVTATDINEETRELRVQMPPFRDQNGVDLVSHKVLSPALYQAAPGAFA